MLPRCGKVLEVRRLSARVRAYDFGEVPLCGLPEGHESYSNCVSEEVVARTREYHKEWRRRR